MKNLLAYISCIILFLGVFQQRLPAQFAEEEKRFHISGFTQGLYQHLDIIEEKAMIDALGPFTENGSFVLADLNLYFTFFIDKGWKAFSEISFLYTPSGIRENEVDLANLVINATPYDNTYMTPLFARSKYGTIEIKRAYIEWNTLPYANVRVGRYFTPFGIWQRDHGAPAVTSIRLPLLVVPALGGTGMPVAQTGVELLGTYDIAEFLLEYAAYVGNGISNADTFSDDDKNKACGAFLNIISPTIAGRIDIEFGGAGYYGKRTLIKQETFNLDVGVSSLTATDPLNPYNDVVLTYDLDPSKTLYSIKQMDTIGCAHLKVSIGDLPLEGTFIFQAEGMYHWADWDKDNRIRNSISGYPVWQDGTEYYSYYGQIEYQFYGKITPYFRFESTHFFSDIAMDTILRNTSLLYCGGLNYKVTPRVVLKAEYYVGNLESDTGNVLNMFDPTKDEKLNNELKMYMASISVAF